MKILSIYPNGQSDTMADLITDGLQCNNVTNFVYNYSDDTRYSDDELIDITKTVDFIFVFWCKYQYKYAYEGFTFKLLDAINQPDKIVYIDGSEYNMTGSRNHKQSWHALKEDSMLNRGELWIDEEMYKRCSWYFKRETYKQDLKRDKIIPLLVSSKSTYFNSDDMQLNEKKYDMFCSFGHLETGLRKESEMICKSLQQEGFNNIIGSNFSYQDYMHYIINSYIGVSAWGAGNSCRRMWEIMSNKTCCFVQKKQIEFPNPFEDGISYVEYSTPQEFEEKARYYLNNKEKCIEIGINGYEHIKKYHTGRKRVEYIFNVLKGINWKMALK